MDDEWKDVTPLSSEDALKALGEYCITKKVDADFSESLEMLASKGLLEFGMRADGEIMFRRTDKLREAVKHFGTEDPAELFTLDQAMEYLEKKKQEYIEQNDFNEAFHNSLVRLFKSGELLMGRSYLTGDVVISGKNNVPAVLIILKDKIDNPPQEHEHNCAECPAKDICPILDSLGDLKLQA